MSDVFDMPARIEGGFERMDRFERPDPERSEKIERLETTAKVGEDRLSIHDSDLPSLS